DFSLEEKIEVQDEVVVTAISPENWQKYFEDFEKAFIGKSRNARKTEIVNSEVLEFDYDEKYDILTAKTDETLIIENKSLGYKIHYNLIEFVMTDKYLVYKGYPRFINLVPENLTDLVEWKENREKTYNGSLRHFLRCLINDDINESDFDVREVILAERKLQPKLRYYNYTKKSNKIIREIGKWGKINISLIPGEIESERTLKFKNYLKVIYKYGTNTSMIGLWGESALLNIKGFLYEPYDLLVTGKWAECRLADLLPFEYNPEKGK
ncbi:MAG: hypothetical protein GY863_10425, partial [bacterium]|nr:hypothetical protein [bacterium]